MREALRPRRGGRGSQTPCAAYTELARGTQSPAATDTNGGHESADSGLGRRGCRRQSGENWKGEECSVLVVTRARGCPTRLGTASPAVARAAGQQKGVRPRAGDPGDRQASGYSQVGRGRRVGGGEGRCSPDPGVALWPQQVRKVLWLRGHAALGHGRAMALHQLPGAHPLPRVQLTKAPRTPTCHLTFRCLAHHISPTPPQLQARGWVSLSLPS